MGLAVVLIIYAIVLTVLAAIAAVVLTTLTHFLTRHLKKKRRQLLFTSAAFPFACVAFAGCWFLCYAFINTVFLHRDPGLGDGWQTPMPNGYSIIFIDTTDQGTVVRGTSLQSGKQPGDNLSGVRQLQMAGDYLLGATDHNYFAHLGQESPFVDGYFLLDTRTSALTEFSSLSELQAAASRHQITVKLKPIVEVFDQYRATWFDYFSFIVLLVIPLIAFVLLVQWVWQTRKRALAAANNTLQPFLKE